MGPVCENRYHTVGAGRQSLEDKFGLPAAQMDDAGDSCGNCVAGSRQGPVNEQVVVCGARSLLAGRRNLDPGGREHYANVRAVHDCLINWLDYVHPSRACSFGARRCGEERARYQNSAGHHDRPLRAGVQDCSNAASRSTAIASGARPSMSRRSSMCTSRPSLKSPICGDEG